jgi:long-chain acyl-CoA synthetase
MLARTLNDVFFSIVDRGLEQIMLTREATRRWLPISSKDFYSQVLALARAFHRWGLAKGERIAILSENRPEWAITDFAALYIGAVTVPIYATLTPEQTAYILADSGAKVVVVSNLLQLQKVLSIKSKTGVQQVVVMDSIETENAIQIRNLIDESPSEGSIDDIARSVSPTDLASIIYTSGTTGTSKGVQLTHGNLTSNILNSMLGFEVGPGDTSVSFLPLSHVTARHVDFALLFHGVTLAYCPFIEDLPQILMEVQPTIFVGVPRVYEKIYAQVDQKVKGAARKKVYRWALSVGSAHCAEVLADKKPRSVGWRVADRVVFSKVRERMGGKVRLFVSGGAPLGKELAQWYADMGICIHEGYGLTETSPVIAINNSRAKKL